MPPEKKGIPCMAITIGTGQAKQLLENGTKQAETLVKDPAQVDALLLRLEEKLKEVPAIGETLSDLPLMISMVKAWINGSYKKVSSKVILCLVGAFLYLVKKGDLIPDDIPAIGIADDLAVLTLALKLSEPELKEYAAFRDSRQES